MIAVRTRYSVKNDFVGEEEEGVMQRIGSLRRAKKRGALIYPTSDLGSPSAALLGLESHLIDKLTGFEPFVIPPDHYLAAPCPYGPAITAL